MVKVTDKNGVEGYQMDIFDYLPKKELLKKYWYRCKKISTGEEVEIAVLATSIKKAVDLLVKHKEEYIPLEYTGWTSLNNNEKVK